MARFRVSGSEGANCLSAVDTELDVWGKESRGEGSRVGRSWIETHLGSPGRIPQLCCCIPGILLFSGFAVVAMTGLFCQSVFYPLAAALTAATMTYTANLVIGVVIGASRLRRHAKRDWHLELLELQAEEPCREVMHVVILPNYKESESMLLTTLQNIARSPLASEHILVILACEEREGEVGRDKAARLVGKTCHLFQDIFATFHPFGLEGEVAGKSSNTQWAYQELMARCPPSIASFDPSRVFVSVGDADTLWHQQYFSALSVLALQAPRAERVWSVWQPPVLLLRNLFDCPAMNRVAGYATTLFELGGMSNQWLYHQMCFSSYTLTLALVSHRLVDGWDTDVIAEDHHMFCKCYSASVWDQLGSGSRSMVVSRMQLVPVYLPALGFLVEGGSWLRSIWDRFLQSRRHSQGISELSYLLLQYTSMVKTHWRSLSLRMHAQTFGILSNMAMVHIVNVIQCSAMICTFLLVLPGVFAILCGVATECSRDSAGCLELGRCVVGRVRSTSWGLSWAVGAVFGPLPPIGLLITWGQFVVVRDVVEGRLVQSSAGEPHLDSGKEECLCKAQWFLPTSCLGASCGTARLGVLRSIALLFMIQSDFFGWAHATLVLNGMIPVSLAAWSLIRNGPKFDYVVAAKPSSPS